MSGSESPQLASAHAVLTEGEERQEHNKPQDLISAMAESTQINHVVDKQEVWSWLWNLPGCNELRYD